MKPRTVILFGATGDLATRKIIPALYELMSAEKQPCRLIGVARDEMSVQQLLEKSKAHIAAPDEAVWDSLSRGADYIAGDFNDPATYARLAALLPGEDDDRLVYCATAATFFEPITAHLVLQGIVRRQDTDEEVWHRIAYEKPFGSDGAHALELHKRLATLLNDYQIYRVDHYLMKKAPLAFMIARLLDESFDDLWRRGSITQMQIVMNEAHGVGTRGHYYDQCGALKDMIQGHALQTVALLGVAVASLDYPDLCSAKRDVLAAMEVNDVLLGQYEGYTHEPHVAADSVTETFAALRLSIQNERWAGIPIFVKTGKMLATQRFAVYVHFSSSDPSRVADMPMAVVAYGDNEVALVVGEEEIATALRVEHGVAKNPEERLQAYGRVLDFIVQGDKTLFVSFDEIVHMWRLVDAVIKHNPPVFLYPAGSNGPKQLEEFCGHNGMKWVI